MKKIKYINFLGTLFLLQACNQSDKTAEINTTVDNATTTSAPITQQQPPTPVTAVNPFDKTPANNQKLVTPQTGTQQQGVTVNANPQAVQPNQQQVQQQIQQQMQQQTVAANTPVASGMNPAHGQPGHRCDIQVGAPLNSKPVAPANPTAAKPSIVQTAQAAVQPQPVAPGMNPAHGQPNHRCDIAVGAPLNSKPVTPTTQTVPAQAPVATPAMSAKADTAKGGK